MTRSANSLSVIFSLVLLVCSSGCAGLLAQSLADSAPPAERALAERIDKSVAAIEGYELRGEFSYATWCTGVVISKRLIAVNAHSVGRGEGDMEKHFRAILIEGNPIRLKVLARDEIDDVALLSPLDDTVRLPVEAVRLSPQLPAEGDEVRILARLSGFGISTVSHIVDAGYGHNLIATSFKTRHGDSGSPVYAKDGKVIGIHALGRGVEGRWTHAVPASAIIRLASTLPADYANVI